MAADGGAVLEAAVDDVDTEVGTFERDIQIPQAGIRHLGACFQGSDAFAVEAAAVDQHLSSDTLETTCTFGTCPVDAT